MATEHVPPFNPQHLQSIAKILADTSDGLTGSEIGYLLRDSKVPDVSPDMTKWKRLFNAFVTIQNEKQIGNYVVMFINRAMNPAQYTAKPHVETTPVPWRAVAVLALSEWSYLRIEEALGRDAATLPKLVRLESVYLRLPGYQLAVIHAAAQRAGTGVDEFLAGHFLDLACTEAPLLSATMPGFHEAFHWPSPIARADGDVALVEADIA